MQPILQLAAKAIHQAVSKPIAHIAVQRRTQGPRAMLIFSVKVYGIINVWSTLFLNFKAQTYKEMEFRLTERRFYILFSTYLSLISFSTPFYSSVHESALH
jgi:hypothetical protein